MTGLHDLDQWTQSQLLLAVLAIVTNVLRHGGTFVAKIFAKEKADLLFCQVGSFHAFQLTVLGPASLKAGKYEGNLWKWKECIGHGTKFNCDQAFPSPV